MKKRRRNTAKPPTPTGRPSAAEFFAQDDDEEDVEEMFRDYYDDEEEPPPRRRLRAYDDDEEDDEEESPPPRLRRRVYDDDDDEEDENPENPERATLYGLRRAESLRHDLEDVLARLQTWLRDNPRLAARWAEFTVAGGVSSDDWEAFLAGNFRSRLTRTRKHLRLVSNRRPLSIRRRRPNDDPDEAA
jgi:hypothetical protein